MTIANPSADRGTMENPFTIEAQDQGDGFAFTVRGYGHERTYVVPTATAQDFNAFFRELAGDFGSRLPHSYTRFH